MCTHLYILKELHKHRRSVASTLALHLIGKQLTTFLPIVNLRKGWKSKKSRKKTVRLLYTVYTNVFTYNLLFLSVNINCIQYHFIHQVWQHDWSNIRIRCHSLPGNWLQMIYTMHNFNPSLEGRDMFHTWQAYAAGISSAFSIFCSWCFHFCKKLIISIYNKEWRLLDPVHLIVMTKAENIIEKGG